MYTNLPKLVFTVPETCKLLGDISRSTLWKLTKAKNGLKPIRIGRRVFFTLSAINAFLDGGKHE